MSKVGEFGFRWCGIFVYSDDTKIRLARLELVSALQYLFLPTISCVERVLTRLVANLVLLVLHLIVKI